MVSATTTKHKASSFKDLGNGKFSFDFSANPLPAYETTLYVEGVKDYSNNEIKSVTTLPAGTEITVVQDQKAVLLTFPEKIGNTAVTFGTGGLTNVKY